MKSGIKIGQILPDNSLLRSGQITELPTGLNKALIKGRGKSYGYISPDDIKPMKIKAAKAQPLKSRLKFAGNAIFSQTKP